MMRNFKFISIVSAFGLLTACATVTTPTTTSPQIKSAQHWGINGQVAVQTAQTGQSASLNWQQQGQYFSMRIFGPLGVDAVQLSGQPGNVQLVTSKGQTYQAASAEALLQKTLGWSVPVTNMQYWVRGLPAPHTAVQTVYDQQRHLVWLVQQGWQINYLSYNGTSSNALPKLIELQRGNNLKIRLAITQWQYFS